MIVTFNTWGRVWITAVLLVGLLISLVILPRQTVRFIAVGEYSVVESLSALNYLAAIIFAFLAAKLASGWLRRYMFLWAAFAFIFLGEETSWLQHYLSYSTPEWFLENNAQQEFNFHNMNFLQGGSAIAAFRSGFDLSILLKSQNLFQLGFFGYFLLLPLIFSTSKKIAAFLERYEIPVIGMKYVAAFFVPLVVSIFLTLLSADHSFVKSAIAETREFIYSLTIALFVYLIWKTLHREKLLPK